MTAALHGQVAVIVGAGGIGHACARALAEASARCVLAGRDGEALAAKLRDLPGEGHLPVAADLADTASLHRLREATIAAFGRVDMLVNAAGFTQPIAHADLDALNDALIDRMFAVNWRGVFATIRAFAPELKRGGAGLIVNISSIAASTGVGSNVAYCAVKAALDNLTRTMARALAPEIRVLSISPGIVDTDFVPGRDRDWRAAQSERTPLAHLVTAADVAAAVIAAATQLRWTTGAIIPVDAGRHL